MKSKPKLKCLLSEADEENVESLQFLFSNQESGGDSVLTWHYRTKSILIIDIPVLRPSTRRTS